MSVDGLRPLELQVTEARMLNPRVRLLRLGRAGGGALPRFEPGAHVQVRVQTADSGKPPWRHYSLVTLFDPWDRAAALPSDPSVYTIAVLKEEPGQGGSRFLHEAVSEGDTLSVLEPRNDFPLKPGLGTAVLVAGGIGITPLASMARHRVMRGEPVRLHYAGRSRGLMAFLPELSDLLGDALQVHADDERGGPLEIDSVLDRCGEDDRLYVCGPLALIDAVLKRTDVRGWPRDRVSFELFAAPPIESADGAFELVLASSGRTLQVGAGQSVLDCLIEAGCDPLFDCRRGECGVCQVGVIEGEIDHRDYVLSAEERQGGRVMQTCVSRCLGQRLVLDL